MKYVASVPYTVAHDRGSLRIDFLSEPEAVQDTFKEQIHQIEIADCVRRMWRNTTHSISPHLTNTISNFNIWRNATHAVASLTLEGF